MASSSIPAILVPNPEERLDFTGERFVPGTLGEIEHEHLHRYFFAMELARGRDVLDVASGEGYGSALLATVARSVVGVELVAEVVQHARRSYARPNLEFYVGDCARLPVESGSIDVAVSFETLEHVEKQAEFLAEIKRVLRPQGLLVMSSPVRGIYSPGNPNPFHVKELSQTEFRDLVAGYFRNVVSLGQTPVVGSAITAEDGEGAAAIRERGYWRQENGSFEVTPSLSASPYLLIVASDIRLPELHVGLLQDRPYMARLLGKLGSATEDASARGADVELFKARLAEVHQQLDTSGAELERAKQVIWSLEKEHRAESERMAAETALARSELESRLGALAHVVEGVARLERELQRLRGTLETAANSTWRAALSRSFSRFRTASRRTIAAFLPKRAKAYIRRKRLNRRSRLMADTGLFDPAYYRAQNPDVAAAGMEPIPHYLAHGAAEGRDPHEMFDTSYYLEQNPDVAANGVNPLLHFHRHGRTEKRRPHPAFTADQYRMAAARQQVASRDLESISRSTPRQHGELAPRRFQTRPLGENPKRTNAVQPQGIRTFAVSHVLPFPPRAGNEYRIHRMVQWLQSIGHEVHLVVCPLPGETLDSHAVTRAAHEYPNLIVCERDGTVLYQSQRPEVRAMLSALAGKQPRSFSPLDGASQSGYSEKIANLERTFCPDHLLDLLLRLEKSSPPEMVISNYIFMSRFLPMFDSRVFKVIDTHDVFSTKISKVFRFGVTGELDITGEDEAALLRRADLIVAIQPDEEIELQALAPDQVIVTAGVDFRLVGEIPSPTQPVVLYVASSNALNVKGIRDFLALAWPLIRREIAGARMLIVGPVCEAVDDGIDGVELLGRVERLEKVYALAKVVVNPAVAGTGLKIKTLEALSHLRPIVVWPAGVDGLSREAQRYCDVAQNWYDFASRVVRQLNDDEAGRIVAHRAEIGRELSPEVVYAALRAKIETGIRTASSREARD